MVLTLPAPTTESPTCSSRESMSTTMKPLVCQMHVFCVSFTLLPLVYVSFLRRIFTLSPIHRATGYCFRSISLYVCILLSFLLSFFLCFFVSKITRKRLDRFARTFQGRCGVTMGRPDSILGQFGETARCRDAQHGDGVCCAFAPQLVSSFFRVYIVK